jgi:thiamine pyrophosphokinase
MNVGCFCVFLAALRITVDGGTDRWFSFLNGAVCIPPDYVIGDMDSATTQAVNLCKSQGTQIIITPDQNETDFTKALKHVQGQLKSRNLKVNCIVFIIIICNLLPFHTF